MKKVTSWNVIKFARIANNFSIANVAKMSGVSSVYINELERGVKTNPSYDIAEKIAESLNLTLYQLVEITNYYHSLQCDDNKKYRLTLTKTLEIINQNLDKDEN